MQLAPAARRLTYVCGALAALSVTALLTETHTPPAQAVDTAATARNPDPSATAAPRPTVPPTTIAAVATAAPNAAPPTTTAPARPARIAAASPTTVPAPRPTAAPPPSPTPVAAAATGGGKTESCGWGWDAQRIDDGSFDGVMISLDAPHRPNSLVTITVAPHGPTTAPTVRATTTDANGQAAIGIRLSEDKRDWTLTVSALFAGSHCTAQSFTITY